MDYSRFVIRFVVSNDQKLLFGKKEFIFLIPIHLSNYYTYLFFITSYNFTTIIYDYTSLYKFIQG